MMVGIDRDAAWTTESLNSEWRIRTHDLDALAFRPAVGIDAQVDRHAEQVEVLRDLAGHAEPRRFLFFDLVVGLIAFGRLRHCGSTQAVRRVFHLELRCASGIEPLREEPGEL